MTSERRFNEAEVAEIFQRAAEAQHTSHPHKLPSSEGMTLVQLQEIGREVGISADQLSYAAKAVERQAQPMERHFLGLPIAVGLTVDIDRKLTDAEWDRLVVDLRETFDARGKLTQEGSFRQWTNGNLQALLEPVTTGHRLRIRTKKGDAQGLIAGGLAMAGFATVAGAAAVATGDLSDTGMLTALGTLFTMGAAMFGFGGLRLPGWARQRRRQMEEVAARTTAAAESDRARLPDTENLR